MGFGSMSHWIVILIIVILLFGAKKLPELAKGVGKSIKTFKKEMADDADVKTITQDEKSEQKIEEISEKKA